MDLDDPEIRHLLWVQDGVIARRQLRALGAGEHDVARMLRRRELSRVHRGVFVNHTGRLSRAQREHAAVQACWPAALGFESALGLPGPGGRIRVVVAAGRALKPISGVWVQGCRRFTEILDEMASPPKVRYAEAAVDAALERGVMDAFALLTEVLHTRRTAPDELRAVLDRRKRARGRHVLEEMIDDIDTGACSVLERGYLRIVERSHGLPRMDRQVKGSINGRTIYRDGEYSRFGVVVELDGLAFHDGARARARDSSRDLETLAGSNAVTIRITYQQVFADGCRTAALIGKVLRERGWTGHIQRCPACQ